MREKKERQGRKEKERENDIPRDIKFVSFLNVAPSRLRVTNVQEESTASMFRVED
jgi:hypothetical protein